MINEESIEIEIGKIGDRAPTQERIHVLVNINGLMLPSSQVGASMTETPSMYTLVP